MRENRSFFVKMDPPKKRGLKDAAPADKPKPRRKKKEASRIREASSFPNAEWMVFRLAVSAVLFAFALIGRLPAAIHVLVLVAAWAVAGYDLANEAFDAGATEVTHLFNAMTGLHHRRPGVVGAALDTDVYCELIADNIHCAPAVQRLVHKIKGLKRLVLITDSMRACGLGDGKSELGGQEVFVKGQRATLADGTIAGSVLTMDRAVYNYAQNNNIHVWQAVQCATITPAQSIGLAEKIGSISAGKQADIVLFDDAVNISMTIRRGRLVFVK